MKTIYFLMLGFFLVLSACSDEEEKQEKKKVEVKDALWRVTSKSGKTSYLFGTIHLYPQSEMDLSQNVVAKLKECEILALERDVTDSEAQKEFMEFKLPEAMLAAYKAIYKEYGSDLASMEVQLVQIAHIESISITGLESAEEAIAALKKMSTLAELDTIPSEEEMIKGYQEILTFYQKGLVEEFHETYADQMGELNDILLVQRNLQWEEDLLNLIEEKNTFIAVGMAHLGGEKGLLKILEERGYQLERVLKQDKD